MFDFFDDNFIYLIKPHRDLFCDDMWTSDTSILIYYGNKEYKRIIKKQKQKRGREWSRKNCKLVVNNASTQVVKYIRNQRVLYYLFR